MTTAPETPLLAVKNLAVSFPGSGGRVSVLHDIGFTVMPGEAIGVVGESGSGKSVTALSIMRLLNRAARIDAGSIRFEGLELTGLSAREMQAVRGARIGMIFQNPMSSLNPVLTVERQIADSLRLHKGLDSRQAAREVRRLLGQVGMANPDRIARSFPHQLSGGMRQRVMIAMALCCEPALIIADEPTTALDVTVQAQILDLFGELRTRSRAALMLITHDLGVVAGIADRIVVMYAGRVVESGPAEALLERPRHPYTQGLIRSIPRLDTPREAPLVPIPGNPPDPARPVGGCAFHVRCGRADETCRTRQPPLTADADSRDVACWHADAPPAPQGWA